MMKIKKEQLKIKVLKFSSIFLLSLTTYYLLPTTSVLAWVPGDPIVPCGVNAGYCDQTTYLCKGGNHENYGCATDVDCGACSKCDLLKLLRNLIDFFMIAAAPILATLFFVIAGVYIMLGGANPGMLATGKRMFKDTIIGLIIVMLTWLIVNTLVGSLAGSDSLTYCVNGTCTNGVSGPCRTNADCGGHWWQFECSP